MNRIFVAALAFLAIELVVGQVPAEEDVLSGIVALVSQGQWRQASAKIDRLLPTNCNFDLRRGLLFQKERIERMRLDFTRNREEVLAKMKQIVPEITEKHFAEWKSAGAIEYLKVDGRELYFKNACYNIFRVHPLARQLKYKYHPPTDKVIKNLLPNINQIMATYSATHNSLNTAKKFKVTYLLTVKPDVVPAGEIVRVWLPFPKETRRQKHIQLIASSPQPHIVAGNDYMQRTVYLEKPAIAACPTVFSITFEYTSCGFYRKIDPNQVTPIGNPDAKLKYFLLERPPHIVFTNAIKQLSRAIVGSETNPYLKARKIYRWINDNIPWASAREYQHDTLALRLLPSQ